MLQTASSSLYLIMYAALFHTESKAPLGDLLWNVLETCMVCNYKVHGVYFREDQDSVWQKTQQSHSEFKK